MFANFLTFKHDRVDTGFSYLFCQKIINHRRLSRWIWGHPERQLRRESSKIILLRFMVRRRWTIRSSNSLKSPRMFGIFLLGPQPRIPQSNWFQLSTSYLHAIIVNYYYCNATCSLLWEVKLPSSQWNSIIKYTMSFCFNNRVPFGVPTIVSSGTVWYRLIIKLFKLSSEGWWAWCDTWYRSNTNH